MQDIKELMQKAYELERLMEQGSLNVLEDVSEQYVKDIKTNTPVDSGKLKESIEANVITSEEVEITAEVDYAVFVEEGHIAENGRFIEGKGMFKKASLNIDKNMQKETNKLLNKISNMWGG